MANSDTNLDTISQSQAQKEATANANFDAMSPAGGFGRHASACSGLTWAYYGSTVDISGTPTQVDNDVVTLTDDDTNYLYLDASGVVNVTTSSPSGWPGPLAASAKALYEVVTVSGFVDSYIDWRTAQGTGLVGAQGPQGDIGATGPQGSDGARGETGLQGATGPQGNTGPQGPKGDRGDAGRDYR